MARYIDADSITYIFRDGDDVPIEGLAYTTEAMVNRVPTANVQEVRHGKWSNEMLSKEDPVFGDLHFGFQCSECGAILNKTKYCGNCGAKMDGEDNER